MGLRTIYLSDNGWVIRRTNVRDHHGLPPTGLTAVCRLSATQNGAAIHASLEVTGVAVTAGELEALIEGENIATYITPLLDAADAANQTLTIFDRVIIAAADYNDYLSLRVMRTRPVY